MHLELSAPTLAVFITVAGIIIAAVVRLEMATREVARGQAKQETDEIRMRALETGHALHEQTIKGLRALETEHAVHAQSIRTFEARITDLGKRSHQLANDLTKIATMCHVQHSNPPPSD